MECSGRLEGDLSTDLLGEPDGSTETASAEPKASEPAEAIRSEQAGQAEGGDVASAEDGTPEPSDDRTDQRVLVASEDVTDARVLPSPSDKPLPAFPIPEAEESPALATPAPKRPRRAKLLGAIAACLGLALLLAIGVWGVFSFHRVGMPSGSGLSSPHIGNPAATTNIVDTRDIDGTKVTSLTIDWNLGHVSVLPVDGLETDGNIRVVDTSDRPEDSQPTVAWTLEKGLLTIGEREGTADEHVHELAVYVPVRVMDHLEKVTLEVDGEMGVAELICDTLVANVRGSLEASAVTAANVQLLQVAGWTGLAGSFGTLDLEVREGEARVECQDAPDSISTKVGTSNLVLYLPEACGFTLSGDPAPSTLSRDQLLVTQPLVHDGKVSTYGDGAVPIKVEVIDGILVISPL